MKEKILEALNEIKLSQTGWEGREDIMTFNGNSIGMTISHNIEIDRWWPELKEKLAEFINNYLEQEK